MYEDFWNGFEKQAGLFDWIKSKFKKKEKETAPEIPERTTPKYFYSKQFNPAYTKAVNSAIRKNFKGNETPITLDYTKANGEKVQRKITPYTAKGGNILVGYDHKRDAIRSFRMDRVDQILSP